MSVSKDGILYLGKAVESGKDGYKVKKWKQKWIVLCGSTLYYYNKKTNFAPSGSVEYQKLQIVEDAKTDKKFAFGIADNKSKTYVFSCGSEEEKKEWLGHIQANKDKEPQLPPANKEKKGMKYSFESNVASSMLGRKIIKESLPSESWQILEALCSFIGQVKGAETAQKFKKSFFKVGTKVGLLHHNKLLSDEVVYNHRQMFLKLGSIVVDFYQMPSIFDCQVILRFLGEMKRGMEERLTPLLSARSMEKVSYVFNLLMDEELITNFFQKKKWKELDTIAVIIRAHTGASRGESAPQ